MSDGGRPDRFRIHTSEDASDPAWDEFVARVRGGHHMQTSLWGQVKQASGWEAIRVVIRQDAEIVAGAQLLTKRLTGVGRLAYGVHTPLWNSPAARDRAIGAIKALARRFRLRAVLVQPPPPADSTSELLDAGYSGSHVDLSLGATVLVDVQRSPDQILASMKAKTRYNIRLASRSPLIVRVGTEVDLEPFHRMLSATAARQGFVPETLESLARMYRTLSASDHAELLVAELEGAAIGSILTIPFGDRVVYKRGAWSGLHGRLHPNERLHWEAMLRARARGFRYYDFDGIDRKIALRRLDGMGHSASDVDSVSRFKLGFGGSIVIAPPTFTYLANPSLRWGHDVALPRLLSQKKIQRVARRFRIA